MRFKQTLALIFRYKSTYNLGLSCLLLLIGIQRFFAPFIACLLFVERRLNWCQLCKHTDVRLQEEQDGQGGGARQVKVSLSAARTTQGSTPMFCWPLCFSILSRLCVSNTLKPWLYIYMFVPHFNHFSLPAKSQASCLCSLSATSGCFWW